MITIDNLKQCGICKEWKPATNEFFSNQKQGALGLLSRCKFCHVKVNRKWRKANPERLKEVRLTWRKANPEKVRAFRQQRRALKANAVGHSTAEQIQARFQYYENRCYYCGDSKSGLHIEHRIPLSRGGSNWPANLVPACQSCNLSKNAKTETEFKKIKGPKPPL